LREEVSALTSFEGKSQICQQRGSVHEESAGSHVVVESARAEREKRRRAGGRKGSGELESFGPLPSQGVNELFRSLLSFLIVPRSSPCCSSVGRNERTEVAVWVCSGEREGRRGELGVRTERDALEGAH